MEHLLGKMGFFIAASVYFFSLILLFSIHTKSYQRNFLVLTICATMLSILGSGVFLQNAFNHFCILGLETLRNLFWIIILMSIVKHALSVKVSKLAIEHKLFTTTLIIMFSIGEIVLLLSFKENSKIMIAFHLLQSTFILFILEQLFRRTKKQHRWKIKPLCLGLGLFQTYDFAFYADALLLQNIDDIMLFAKGWVALLAAPFLILSIRRIQDWSLRIYVSRDIVYSSTLLIAVGCYLVFMSAIGYFINYLEYTWSTLAQHIFLTLSFILFACLFFSETLRYRLKKFIIKHFYENKYDYCQEWMNFSTNLENKNKTPYQIALSSMMKPFNCDSGMLLEFNKNKFNEKAKVNMSVLEHINTLFSLCKKAIEHKWIIVLDELREGTKKQPFQYQIDDISPIKQIKYIIPITAPGNVTFVCLLSQINHEDKLDFEDKELLKVLSKHLSIFLDLHITNNTLVENQQFSAFNQMSTFLIHDLKNILSQLELISKNSKKHRNKAEFIDDTFITIASASTRLNKVLSHLLKHKTQEYNHQIVNIYEVVKKAFTQRQTFSPTLKLLDDFDHEAFIFCDKEKLTNILLNLIKNAQDACAQDGLVTISCIDKMGYFVICIEDNGEGMTDEFIANRLFKPFDTTKGNAGLGVGAYDAKKYIEQLNGYIDVFSIKGKGTRFEIYLPKAKKQVRMAKALVTQD